VHAVCLNCQTRRRPVYRAGHCSKCYYWHQKRREAQRIASSGAGIAAQRAQLRIKSATRILKEYAWREGPLNRKEVHALELEALVYTVAAECRSGFSFALHSWLDGLTAEARMCFYCILLEIVENTPASHPRFHTLEPPSRGSYLRPRSDSGLIGDV
jgi:hypothetical protein